MSLRARIRLRRARRTLLHWLGAPLRFALACISF